MNPILKKALLVTVLAGATVIAKAQDGVGIGTRTPHSSAILHIESTNKGLLIPRVSLTNVTDQTTITSPANGLLVFNTNTSITGGKGEGFYYWSAASSSWIYTGSTEGKGVPGMDGKPGAAGTPGGTNMVIDNTTGIVYVLKPGADPNDPNSWVPLNGLDGKDGLPGGTGVPGKDGVVPESNIWVNEKGEVYALKAGGDRTKPEDWILLNGKDGLNGENGLPGGPGKPGDPGVSAPDNIWVDTNTNFVYAYKGPGSRTDLANWILLNGTNGKDGIPGVDGKPGEAGFNPPYMANIIRDAEGNIYGYVGTDQSDAQRNNAANWVRLNGINGQDGIAGANGVPGTPGSITTLDAIVKDPNGDIYAYVGTDKTVAGRDAEWAAKSPNWVKINGTNGKDGITGATGAPGTPGSITTLDAIVKDPNGDIYAYVGTDKTVAGRDAEWAAKSPNWVKINGIDGRDGSAGLKGGDGAPGTPGTPGLDGTTQMYVDKTTGIVYVRDPNDPTKWIPISNTINNLTAEQIAPGAENQYLQTVLEGTELKTKWTDLTIKDQSIKPGTSDGLVLTTVGEGATAITQWKKPTVNAADITSGADLTTTTDVLEVTGTGSVINAASINIKPGTAGQVLTTNADASGVEWKAPAANNIMGIKVVDANYTVTTEDYTIIAKGMADDITITLPDATTCKGRLLVINQYDLVKAGGGDLVVKFNVPVTYSKTTSVPYIGGTVWGGYGGSAKITLQSDGTNWYVISYSM